MRSSNFSFSIGEPFGSGRFCFVWPCFEGAFVTPNVRFAAFEDYIWGRRIEEEEDDDVPDSNQNGFLLAQSRQQGGVLIYIEFRALFWLSVLVKWQPTRGSPYSTRHYLNANMLLQYHLA